MDQKAFTKMPINAFQQQNCRSQGENKTTSNSFNFAFLVLYLQKLKFGKSKYKLRTLSQN